MMDCGISCCLVVFIQMPRALFKLEVYLSTLLTWFQVGYDDMMDVHYRHYFIINISLYSNSIGDVFTIVMMYVHAKNHCDEEYIHFLFF